jgi:hypothetical protein
VVSFAVVSLSFGAGVSVVVQALHGCVIGGILAMGVIQCAVMLVPARFEIARDGVCFILFAVAALFFVSRKNLELTTKKFTGAILVVGVFSVVNTRYRETTWYGPIMNIVPTFVGCLCGLVALLLPFPVMASDEIAHRLRLQTDFVRLILDEQLLLVLRSEASMQCHSELLLSNIEENRDKINSMLTAVEFEQVFKSQGNRAGKYLKFASKFLEIQIPFIRGKQHTLRGRHLTGRSKLSNVQVCVVLLRPVSAV